MTEKTFKEALQEFSKKVLDLNPARDFEKIQRRFFGHEESNTEWMDLYDQLNEEGIICVDTAAPFISLITVVDSEGKRYEFKTNAIAGQFLNCWAMYDCFATASTEPLGHSIITSEKFFQDIKCVTLSLEQIQKYLTDDVIETVFKGHHVLDFSYLLANPRQDVIEWALKHKEELGLSKVEREFIEEYQAIPELKELILNTLEKKGE